MNLKNLNKEHRTRVGAISQVIALLLLMYLSSICHIGYSSPFVPKRSLVNVDRHTLPVTHKQHVKRRARRLVVCV